MKKYYYILLAFGALLTVSCNKETEDTAIAVVETSDIVTMNAVVNERFTKTDYTISGSDATFEWSSGDSFYRLVRVDNGDGSYGNYNHYTYNLTSGAGESDATFSGSSVEDGYDDSFLALYPAYKTNGATLGYTAKSSTFYFEINEELVYDKDNELKDIVPMIGTLSGDTYTFAPVMGVIAITATNIPSTATSLTISSTSGGMSGKSVTITSDSDSKYRNFVSNLGITTGQGLRMGWFTAGNAKTYTFSGLDPAETYTFYFPVPTGTYANLTVTLNDAEGELGSVTKNSSTTVSRGVITNITNTISFDNAKYCNVAISGNPTSFSAYVASKSASISYVKVGIASTTDAALTAAASGTTISSTGVGNAVAMSGDLSTSGKYYIGYVGYNSSDNSIIEGTVPCYFITSADNSQFPGTYYVGGNSSYSLTLSASSDASLGNVCFTAYTTWSLTGHIYGYYDASASTLTIDDSQMFDIYNSSTYYGINNGTSGAPSGSLAFEVSISAGKVTLSRSGFGISIATSYSGGKALSYTVTSHRWTSGTCNIVQQ